MNTTYKKVGGISAALLAGSLLLVPVLQASAGSLPNPDTVPCEAFGSDPDCLLRRERRNLEHRCGVPVVSTDTSDQPDSGTSSVPPKAADDPTLVDLLPHTTRW
jgi:hypothetical protein